jgi:hypothetical protein
MPGVGIAVLWIGYAITYYGVTQVQGGNWGLLDLVAPGRWTNSTASIPKDASSSSSAVQGLTTQPVQGQMQIVNPGTGNADIVPPPANPLYA